MKDRKQFINYETGKTGHQTIKCGVPQGSILGPPLFIIYVNDLCNSSDLLKFIMFADDTNVFLSHTDLKYLFETANQELEKANEWFICNKLSLNLKKTNFILFRTANKSENLPLKLPSLRINN